MLVIYKLLEVDMIKVNSETGEPMYFRFTIPMYKVAFNIEFLIDYNHIMIMIMYISIKPMFYNEKINVRMVYG